MIEGMPSKEEVSEYLNLLVDSLFELYPKYAKLAKILYDSLIEEGFTKKEAMDIMLVMIKNQQVGK